MCENELYYAHYLKLLYYLVTEQILSRFRIICSFKRLHVLKAFPTSQSKYFRLIDIMENNVNGNVFNANDSEVPVTSADVKNVSYADALRKDNANTQNCTTSSNVDNLNNVSDLSVSDVTAISETGTHSGNETSELDTTYATCESLQNAESTLSDTTLDISNSLSEEQVTSDVKSEQKDTLEVSTYSEATDDQTLSEVLLNSSQTKTETSSSSLSASEIVGTNEEAKGSSSDLVSEEYNGSEEEEEESSDDVTDDIAVMYPTALKWTFRDKNPKLPDTVTVLTSPNGSKVYLIGTAHFSLESQDDVSKTIRAVQPDVVMVELCKSRINVLSQDEETILEESKNMNLEKIRAAIQQNGFKQGILYLLLLNVSAHLTKQLGMAPGGEFRRAFTEAKKVPGCVIQLGDRPIQITLQRALAKLSVWQKFRIAWHLLTNKDPISQQEVERCKQKDLLEEMLAEMTGEFPVLSEVFVRERNIYLAYSLQMATAPMPSNVTDTGGTTSKVVVGVVGIGHVPGIVENWNKVSEDELPAILSIPEPSLSSKILYRTVQYSAYGLVIYGCYRLIPGSVWQKPINIINSWFSR